MGVFVGAATILAQPPVQLLTIIDTVYEAILIAKSLEFAIKPDINDPKAMAKARPISEMVADTFTVEGHCK